MSAWASRLAATMVLAIAIFLTFPEPATGQRAPTFGGAELRFGLVLPEAAEVGTGLMAEVDLGYVYTPSLRLLTGFSRFVADIDREPGGDEGSYTAHGGWLGGRFDFTPLRRLSPYVKAAFTAQSVNADAFDPDIGRLLDGLNMGMGAAVGARFQIGGPGSIQATTELRRTFINNVGNSALEIGVRWQRRGQGAYFEQGRPVAFEPVLPAPPPPPAVPDPEPGPPAAEPTPPLAWEEQSPLPPIADPTPVPAVPTVEAPVPSTTPDATPAARAAAEAMLRQGIRRASSSMRSVTAFDETAGDFVVTIGGGAFESASAEPTPEARQELRLLATVLAGYPGHIVRIEGHADASGDAALNRRLAGERAAVIRAGLIAEGVDPLWIAALGHGPDRPIATNETASGRAQNRRVEIWISKLACTEPPFATATGALVCPS